MAIAETALGGRIAAPARIVRITATAALPALVLLAFTAEASLFITHAYLNRDEGWYILSGRLAYQGQVPYRDFPYFQMPLLPYLFGGLHAALPQTIESGRIIAAAFGVATMALVLYVGSRLGRIGAATLACLVLLGSVDFMLASSTARAEAIVLPLTLAAVALALRWPAGLAGFAAAPAVLLLATAARLTFAPAFAAALVYCCWRAQPSRRELAAGALGLVALGTLVMLPLTLSPGRAWFDVWSAQAMRNGQFATTTPGFLETSAGRTAFLSVPATSFFVVAVPLLLYAAYLAHAWRDGWRPQRPGFDADAHSNHLVIAGLALLLWLPFVGFDRQEPRYFVPSFALLAIVCADVVWRARAGLLDQSLRLLPALFALLFAAQLVFQLPVLADSLDRDDLRLTGQAGARIRELAGDDGRLVTLNPTLAVAARVDVPPPLVMGQFSLWGRFSGDRARSDGVVNVDLLEREMLDPRTRVIALDDYDLNVIAAFRNDDLTVTPNAAWPFKLFPSLIGKFELQARIDDFGQFAGTLYILGRVG